MTQPVRQFALFVRCLIDVSGAPRLQPVPLTRDSLRATVMGLGAFGGGAGAARFLADRGAQVTVTDLKPAVQLQPAIQSLADVSGITYHLGRHDERHFIDTDLLVVSPAVPRDSPYLLKAVAAGVPLTSEMNLFWQHIRGQDNNSSRRIFRDSHYGPLKGAGRLPSHRVA